MRIDFLGHRVSSHAIRKKDRIIRETYMKYENERVKRSALRRWEEGVEGVLNENR